MRNTQAFKIGKPENQLNTEKKNGIDPNRTDTPQNFPI